MKPWIISVQCAGSDMFLNVWQIVLNLVFSRYLAWWSSSETTTLFMYRHITTGESGWELHDLIACSLLQTSRAVHAVK